MMRKAAGLIVINSGRILMVERGKEGSRKIAIPGGKLEPYQFSLTPNEEPEYPVDGAIRETYEETGLVCHVPYEDWAFHHNDVEGFEFTAFRAKAVAGTLRSSAEGNAFWLDLRCFKAIPSILQYPEWSRQAIKFFKL